LALPRANMTRRRPSTLSALQVKHAHLRQACLMRSLLVIDEVHASDVYMTALTEQLLANHVRAGGHALLMSATLGSVARSKLLAPASGAKPAQLIEAANLAYPALWNGPALLPQPQNDRCKDVTLSSAPLIERPDGIAGLIAEHIAAGAKVLVIRNTVAAAQATQAALEARLGADHTAPCVRWTCFCSALAGCIAIAVNGRAGMGAHGWSCWYPRTET
jgi:CRISPR-associated endonuclease/helicase Cas3